MGKLKANIGNIYISKLQQVCNGYWWLDIIFIFQYRIILYSNQIRDALQWYLDNLLQNRNFNTMIIYSGSYMIFQERGDHRYLTQYP